MPQSKIHLNTQLQAIAVKVTLHKTINICSIYIPPHDAINESEINNILQQLPTPFIPLDFNSHNTIWGCRSTNHKGQSHENIINYNNLCLFFKKSPTHLDPSSATYSAIDLTLCDTSLFLDFTWRMYNDTCGSNHFPIVLESLHPQDDDLPRWRLNKANWEEFCSQCQKYLIVNNTRTILEFSRKLINIAKTCIPHNPIHKQDRPWFSKECKQAIHLRWAALRKFNTEPTTSNLISFKFHRANARKIIREAKKKSRQNCVSKLDISSNIKTVWLMIWKIAGKKQSTPLKHLSVTNQKITGKKAIADLLAETFSKNSSSQFNTEFYKIKPTLKKKKIRFSSNNSEEYNKPFTLTELVDSIKKSNHSAVGPDEVHNEFLKQLPDESVKCLLKLYNNIWVNSTSPGTWKQSIIVPIPKSGKNILNPQNYRPIALSSCLCKSMEQMINSRLTWYLETNGLITNMQMAFRKRRGTIDHLIWLETFIRKQHLTAVFFVLEKAYDTTWKYGIIWDLYDLGLRGRLPMFIKNFLFERTFRVRMGSTFSNSQYQEEGVPQGSILSVTLFSIKINNIVKCLTPSIDCALYVEDFVICYRATHMNIVERQLQLNLNKVNKWARENGFKFSKSKTKCMHFCSLRKMHNDPLLKIDESKIPVVNEYKFLSVIFDKNFHSSHT